jgi:hypothetical protein
MKSFQQFTEGKDSKLEANYQDKPKGNQICSECTMWRPPNACSAVLGSISPNGWCDYFKQTKRKD